MVVVQPPSASSAKPTHAETCTDSSSMRAHNGYRVCNHGNNVPLVAGR